MYQRYLETQQNYEPPDSGPGRYFRDIRKRTPRWLIDTEYSINPGAQSYRYTQHIWDVQTPLTEPACQALTTKSKHVKTNLPDPRTGPWPPAVAAVVAEAGQRE
ncbi:hypothetical protein AG1IA_08372 [Rhizoctonia solani AG-1 IA]|uniref:Uncharacterized protein n=1 Tax=Thanatephorus cucumeris (strain AG1-IA) TaxID=983506 RepID=L8WMM3_THACA|nr:hypothetical protein AG1IA_08372 [Rhizoctonia solani AG-1 IA]